MAARSKQAALAAQGGSSVPPASAPKTVADSRIVVGRVTVTKSTTSHRTVK